MRSRMVFPVGSTFFGMPARSIRTRSRSRTFKSYIAANQIQTNYYYNATPGAAQRDIKAALRVRREVRALAAIHQGGDTAAFARAYHEAVTRLANSLASPGYAPIASVATRKADAARRAFIADLIAKRGGPHA